MVYRAPGLRRISGRRFSQPHRSRHLSINSLGWSDGCWLCVRCSVSVGRSEAPATVVDHGKCGDNTFHLTSSHKPLWRSITLVPARHYCVYDSFISEHDKVSTVIAILTDDAWAGDFGAGMVRTTLHCTWISIRECFNGAGIWPAWVV